jgi:hypothetical protein
MNINDTIHHFEFEIEKLTDEIQKSMNHGITRTTNKSLQIP